MSEKKLFSLSLVVQATELRHKMSRSHQPTLEDLFPNITIAPTEPSHSLARTMSDTLRNSLRRSGFPSWNTLKWRVDAPSHRREFTLTLDYNIRSYHSRQNDPHVEFGEARELVEEIKDALGTQEAPNKDNLEKYISFTQDSMADLIFGSNYIERAGLGHDETRRICLAVFNGETIDAGNVSQQTDEYEGYLRYIRKHQQKANPKLDDVIQSRREIIQHAHALNYITDMALNRDLPLTEELIKETHRILCNGIPIEVHNKDGTRTTSTAYAGQYRTHDVMAGATKFVNWQQVPSRMQVLLKDFNDDVQGREHSGELDPFYLAADVCQDFVTIHPFADGNGRMCRLLLNAYLVKYVGIMVCIGEHDHDRNEYLSLAAKAGDGDLEEEARGQLGRFVLEKGAATLRRLVHKLKGH